MIDTKEVFKKYTDELTFSKIVDYGTVSEMFLHSVETYPNHIALVDGEEITYQELEDRVAKERSVLAKQGVKAKDFVGVYSPNSSFFVVAYLAITTLGACAVLLPPQLDDKTIFGCSLKFKLSHLLYDEVLSANVEFLKVNNPRVCLISSKEETENSLPAIIPNKEDPCTVIFTGGTTGKSKGALLSNQAVMRGTKNGCYGIKEVFEQKLLLVLPLTHVFGLIRNLLTSLYTGSSLYICRSNKNMFKEMLVYKPTTLVFVPALAEMALKLSKQFNRNMLGDNVKTIICGAATVAPYLAKEYAEIGITLLPGYGLTESANLVSGNPIPLEDSTSVGFIYPDMEYKIVDDELWIKGINVMDEYIGDPEENALSFEDGYFKTGDLVKINEKGMLYITGRKKEIIVLSSGENVYPAEIENKIYELDTVQDCLIYEDDQRLVLEILPRVEVVSKMNIQNLKQYFEEQIKIVNKTLMLHEQINEVIIRETDFVRSAAMKILRSKNGKNRDIK